MSRLIVFLAAVLLGVVGLPLRPAVAAEDKGPPIRLLTDAEIEDTITSYATPIFEAAGVSPESVHFYLVNDRGLNAFVAGGQNLFINAGLLMRTSNAGQVIGTIAHETGHIAGGHLIRTDDALADATGLGIVGFILGGAAGLATGRPDVAQAIMMGSQDAGMRNFMSFSRTQESSADQAALTYLNATGQSAKGMLELMELLGGQELLSPERQDPYVRTHPLSSDRIAAVRAHVETSRFTNAPVSSDDEKKFARMRAKLLAFLDPPGYTFRRYRDADTSVEARYGRAIAYFRDSQIEPALAQVDSLIKESPRDPYFHELKGQILYEFGRTSEALKSYTIATHLLPDSPVMRELLGQVQIESGDEALLDEAIANLNLALHKRPDDAGAWRSLAIAHGRKGDEGMSALALAEEAMLRQDKSAARYQAGKAQQTLARGSRGWLKAQDILESLRDDEKDKEPPPQNRR